MQFQSRDPINYINREINLYGLSQTTFFKDQSSNTQRIYVELYSKVRNGDAKGVQYILGIKDDDSLINVQPINIQQIVDEKQNTLLMHAVWKDNTQIFIDLIKYTLQNFGKSETQQWVTQQNDSGVQCMHLATQKGNIEILDTILKLGIQLDQKTKLGQTTLHIASQSNQPILLYYLIKIAKVNIDITDNDNSTALHLASDQGSEQCASLLLAWGCKINQKNINGCSPLHVAARGGEIGITKKLLFYNAKTRLRNKQGKTAYQLSIENEYYDISQMILEYQEGNIKCNNLFGQKNKARINKKCRFQMYTFILMLILNLIYQILFTIGNNLFGYIQIISDIFELFLFIYIVNSDPGYQIQYKQEGQLFYQILQNNPQNLEICSECETLKAKRSIHCDFCNRCIIVFDHHCPWINNCIGAKNHFVFIIFIWLTFLIISLQLFISIVLFINIIWKQTFIEITSSKFYYLQTFDILFDSLNDLRIYLSISKGIQIEYIVFQFIITSLFFVLMIYLICRQMKNMLNNKTTFERLRKKSNQINNQQSSLIENSQMENEINDQNRFRNCCLLLFWNKNCKDYNYFYHDNISLTTAIIS